MSKAKNPPWRILLAIVYLLSGCAAQALHRTHPGFAEQAQRIHTVALLPSEVKVYQIDAGGIREEITEWSNQARNHLMTALQNELGKKQTLVVKIISEESLAEDKAILEETRALYGAVSAMILLHTYSNPNLPGYFFEEKLKNFNYSLGGDVSGLAEDAEAMLLLDAEDHVWTAGRQALQALGIILGIGAGVATGVVVIPQMGGGTAVRAALVDSRTGDILWINAVAAGAGKDLRDATSAGDLVSELFKDFPGTHDREQMEESR